MPHAGHFICGNECKFHLNTYVGKYIVSTVGEYFPDAPVREIFAQSRGITLTGIGDFRRADYLRKIGYEELGFGRKYETMVFKATEAKLDLCCPYRQANGSELDMAGYNEPEKAREGHMKLCAKWAKK